MKYCQNCRNQISDDALICSKCGCTTNNNKLSINKSDSNTLKTITKIFMIVGCISSCFAIIPLLWTIPMTVYYFRCCQNNIQISTLFKVCTLLFVNIVSGILMLCDNEI